MPKLTMTVPIKIFFNYHSGSKPSTAFPSEQPNLEITSFDLPKNDDLEEWLWEAKDEWEED